MNIAKTSSKNKRLETKEIILSSIVAEYFPNDIKNMFGLPEDGLFFFGESNRGTDGKGKFSSNYLLLLHKPAITKLNVSFNNSDRRWIQSEHDEFLTLKNSYPEQLYHSYPLLVLRLTSEYMRESKPIHYMNLLRYADHETFRRRGIATGVFNSVADKLKQDGVKYLYIDARFELPSTSKWLSRKEVPSKDLAYISTLFFDKPKKQVLPWNDSYLRIL
ncbi:MAG: hypothetical protein ACP5N2_04470 [Candidatus Nanoarchaeia archaeon]